MKYFNYLKQNKLVLLFVLLIAAMSLYFAIKYAKPHTTNGEYEEYEKNENSVLPINTLNKNKEVEVDLDEDDMNYQSQTTLNSNALNDTHM